MTPEELEKIKAELKAGKIYSLGYIDYGYGDATERLIRYHPIFKEFVSETYSIHGNGEELTRSRTIPEDELGKSFRKDFQATMDQLAEPGKYPYV